MTSWLIVLIVLAVVVALVLMSRKKQTAEPTIPFGS